MKNRKNILSRRDFIKETTWAGAGLAGLNGFGMSTVIGSMAQAQTTNGDTFYRRFQNPPTEYDPIPLWTWNGRIEIKEAKRQIDEMLKQGIKRAIVYPFPNLRIRFLSDDWWALWGEVLSYSRANGFQLGVNAENQWPDGDGFDQWLNPPDQSHVLLGHPEYHMKRLAYIEKDFVGPGTARFEGLPSPLIAIAAKFRGQGKVDSDNLIDVSRGIAESSFSAELPGGDWRLMFFYLERAVGSAQELRIDPLNRAAVARFIDLTLGEYYRKFREYIGNTFTFVLVDNEGDYGNHIGWTPALFETFQSEKGYDLRRYLPLLVHDGGPKTPKVRVDYLRVISDLYERNYWGQIADWCKAHGLEMTAQGWSESLQYDAAYGGDYMQMMRSLGMPGVEALGYKGRSPREFIENQSIANFERRRYWCEGPLVLGSTTYLSPQMERYTTNMLALWGIDLWSPQFYYDVPAMCFPPDDFISQPWWKYFHHYTDYLRRISFMNGNGKHIVNLLLYRPVDTTFAYADPLFKNEELPRTVPESTGTPPSATSRRNDSGSRGGWGIDYPRMLWKTNFAATVETAYFDLMEMLSGNQRSYNVVDDYYMNRMELDNGTLRISDMAFRAIILPPMKVINRGSLAKIRRFYEQGGLVIAFGDLPNGSSEEGWGDPAVTADVSAIFGIASGPKRDSENHNSQGGKAYFVVGNVEKVLKRLDENLEPDMKVVEGSRERLLFLHKNKEGRDIYWIVNDTDRPRKAVLSFAAKGKPQIWDPATGGRRDVPHWVDGGRTILPLNFHVWDATYVIFDGSADMNPEVAITDTNLETYSLQQTPTGSLRVEGLVPAKAQGAYIEGTKGGKKFRVSEKNAQPIQPQVLSAEDWSFKPQASKIDVRYAREKLVLKGMGFAAGCAMPDYSDLSWHTAHLSPERATMRDWWVLGPFPNPNHGEGYNTAYPPEREPDVDGNYIDANGVEIGWRLYHSAEPVVNLNQALALDPKGEPVAYAMTWVYSPREEQVNSLLVAPNAKLWINGDLIFAGYNRPNYFEWRDPFGYKSSALLRNGWNQVLVKVVGDYRHPELLFYLHFLDNDGAPVEELLTGWHPNEREALKKTQEGDEEDKNWERWYRLEVPAGTRAFLLPPGNLIQSVYLNGQDVKPIAGKIEYPNLSFHSRAVLTLMVPGGKKITSPLSFESGDTPYKLGCWTGTGLQYYVGSASYEKTFELAPELEKQEIELDCGSVGVAAEIWLNEQKIGERIWEPFTVNVTRFLKPGKNRLRIVVSNTYAPMRTDPANMSVIDMNGLVGPVRFIPYRKARLTVHL